VLQLQLELHEGTAMIQLQLATITATAATATLGFYEETLIFQLSNFGILIQGLDALG
jgi:hypothetical protein